MTSRHLRSLTRSGRTSRSTWQESFQERLPLRALWTTASASFPMRESRPRRREWFTSVMQARRASPRRVSILSCSAQCRSSSTSIHSRSSRRTKRTTKSRTSCRSSSTWMARRSECSTWRTRAFACRHRAIGVCMETFRSTTARSVQEMSSRSATTWDVSRTRSFRSAWTSRTILPLRS